MSSTASQVRPIKTLQIGNDWPTERVGGLNRYFADLLRYLPGAGAEVRGLVVGAPEIAAATNGLVMPFARSSDPLLTRLWRARQAALQQLGAGTTDLIVSHFALYTAPLQAHASEWPMVVQFHGPWAAESHVEGAASLALHLKKRIEQGVYRRARRFIVLSRSFQHELVTRYGVDEAATRIIPGGIDINRFHTRDPKRDARVRLGWPTDRPILLAVRRLVRRMGLENLLEAMQTVVRRTPEALLLIGGKGPLAAELQGRIHQHGLQANVRLLGRIEEEDLPFAYRAADATVVPSQALEGFGMITLESLASGTPVFVTPVGGLPEIVQPFAPGCVFASTETQAIASVLGEVFAGTQTLPGERACRDYAVRNYAWPLIAERLCTVYREALG